MKKVLHLLIIIFACILTFNQCKKCHPESLGDVKFSETDLKILPYNGTEILVYKDSVGDSIIYQSKGLGRNSSIVNVHVSPWEQNLCEPNYYKVEKNETEFFCGNTGSFIKVELFFYNVLSNNYNKSVDIDINYSDSQFWVYNGGFYFDALELFNRDTNYSEINAFNDSLFIGPMKNYAVYTLVQNKEPVNAQNLKTIYYTIADGIVGFKTDTGHLWYLKK